MTKLVKIIPGTCENSINNARTRNRLILLARSGWEKERKQELVNNLEPWVRFGGKRFVRYDGIIDSKIVFPT